MSSGEHLSILWAGSSPGLSPVPEACSSISGRGCLSSLGLSSALAWWQSPTKLIAPVRLFLALPCILRANGRLLEGSDLRAWFRLQAPIQEDSAWGVTLGFVMFAEPASGEAGPRTSFFPPSRGSGLDADAPQANSFNLLQRSSCCAAPTCLPNLASAGGNPD